MEKITNININQQENNKENVNKENINPNNEDKNKNIETNSKLNNQKQNQIKFNLNSKYDSALLEELNNSKTKSWRMDITNVTHEEENEIKFNSKKINLNEEKIESNEKKENEEINKDDRFKDFDEILIIEENKDKKRKNKSVEKLINTEKLGKIPKPNEKRKNINANKHFIQDNNNINKNSSTLSELNKCFDNNDNNEELGDKKNDNVKNDENNKNSIIIINNEKSNNQKKDINETINNSKENNDNKYKSINLEYSEDKKSYKEKEEKKYIKNIVEVLRNKKITIDYLYNNYMDIKDKNKDIEKYSNDSNKDLIENNNSKTKNIINNKKVNKNLPISKSCNIKNNQLNKKSNKENNFIYPNKSQNLKRNIICDKNTINIHLSMKRTTRSAKDIKKHMSYYLMDGIIKSPKNEIKNIQKIMNKNSSKRNYYSNNISLNSFLSLQIGYNNINPKNQINYINTPFSIFKNSFTDKIKKKMNYVNANKKHKIQKNTKSYVDLEFFEESKQDNFYGTKNKLFEKQNKNVNIVNKYNFYKSQNDFYHNNNKENDMFFSNSKKEQEKSYNNYLFKNYNINNNKKRIFSFTDDYKSSDFYKDKNEIFGTNFNWNINPVKKYEFKYDSYSNKNFNTNKNINFQTIKPSKSFTSILQNKLSIKDNSNHSHLFSNNYNNRNYRSDLIKRKTGVFHNNFYL